MRGRGGGGGDMGLGRVSGVPGTSVKCEPRCAGNTAGVLPETSGLAWTH